MKSRKKKPWLAWIIGSALCLVVPCAIVGRAAFTQFASRIGSNKAFVKAVIQDHYAGKDTTEFVVVDAREQVKIVLEDAQRQLGKCLSFNTADTVPSFGDAFSRGWELTYDLPVQFDKGYKTFIIRVRNEDTGQKIISMSSVDGITPKNSIKRQIKEQIQGSSDKNSQQ